MKTVVVTLALTAVAACGSPAKNSESVTKDSPVSVIDREQTASVHSFGCKFNRLDAYFTANINDRNPSASTAFIAYDGFSSHPLQFVTAEGTAFLFSGKEPSGAGFYIVTNYVAPLPNTTWYND